MIDRMYWILPGQIMVFEVAGEVMLQDVRDIIATIRSAIEAEGQTQQIDVFLDVTRVTSYHPETMNIRKLFGAVKRHERVRWNVIVNPNPNPVADFVIGTVTQLFKTQLKVVRSLDDALAFIQTKTVSERS